MGSVVYSMMIALGEMATLWVAGPRSACSVIQLGSHRHTASRLPEDLPTTPLVSSTPLLVLLSVSFEHRAKALGVTADEMLCSPVLVRFQLLVLLGNYPSY